MPQKLEAIVIGSGFGGAITACRLSRKWPGKVLLLERGKRYPMGSFPRSPHDFARNFWNVPPEKRHRPGAVLKQDQRGLYDVRRHSHMDLLLCAGLGGGSLIYANVFLMPPDDVFDSRWPASCARQNLMPYYRVAREVLGARPVPRNGDPRRRIIRTGLFELVAAATGRKSELADINVFFGNDFTKPLPMGEQQRNRYGALQTSCVYCAECTAGCNYHAKNTLDLNYLFAAEARHQAALRTEHLAEKIVPVNARDEDDPAADGSFGYRVYFRDLSRAGGAAHSELARRVVVSAGSLGSTEILLRCKQVFHTLPRISDRLGSSFSGNGDFILFVLGGREAADPNYGPTITQLTDHNLFEKFDRKRAFIVEDGAYPNFCAWFVEGFKPDFLRLGALWRWMRNTFDRWVTGASSGSIGYAFSDLMSADLSYNTSILLCIGLDKSNGVLSLDRNGWIDLRWPYRDSLPLYRAILEAGKEFRKVVGAKKFFPLPTWFWPFRRNVTVHALGGCILADDPSQGVTSAGRAVFGQVFGYQGLYVADGAIVPAAVGANPAATISALSEMVAEAITGIVPDANL